jgi:hypothetical protein
VLPSGDGPGGPDGPTVVRATTAAEVAAVLGGEGPGGATVLVVEEEGDDGPPPTESLLTRLSVARLAAAEPGRALPPLVVCCRGAARADRLRSFVVDEVVDAGAVEASWATAFAAVYYGLLAGPEAPVAWPAARRAAAAGAVGDRLAHLDVWRATDSPAGHGEPIGVARLAVDDDDGEPVVTVDVVAPAPGGPRPGDLLLARRP